MILTEVFQAENISKTATIYLKAPVDIVFPLFGPFEEKKWADGWNPDLLYPHQEKVAVGVSFTTEGNRFEGPYTWRINEYDASAFRPICTSCDDGYILINNTCQARLNTISFCNTYSSTSDTCGECASGKALTNDGT